MAIVTSLSLLTSVALVGAIVGIALPHGVFGDTVPSPIPISVPTPGFYLGSAPSSTKVTLEAFLDINCPDSAAIWGDLQQVATQYAPKGVAVRILWCPLPYHRNAMLGTQGYFVVNELKPEKVVPYISKLFDTVGEWSTAATVNMTEYDVITKLASAAESATDIPTADFVDKLGPYRSAVIAEWKYSVRRTVGGTPWYFVNGIDIGNGVHRLSDWTKFLDDLLQVN